MIEMFVSSVKCFLTKYVKSLTNVTKNVTKLLLVMIITEINQHLINRVTCFAVNI